MAPLLSSRWLRSTWVSAALLLFAASGCTAKSYPTVAPGASVAPIAAIDGAEQFQIFRLDPDSDGPKPNERQFQGYLILGQADVKDSGLRAAIVNTIDSGVRKGGNPARCFNPRHGVHIVRGGKSTDVVICYQCSTILIFENGGSRTVPTGDVQSDLERVFSSAGLR